MSRPRRYEDAVVFIAEDEDAVSTAGSFDHYFTGRFGGHRETATRMAGSFEDLSLPEALDWARERADRIVVRIGYGPSYAIGFARDDLTPWPEGGLPEPERRRFPDEAWKDRTEADPDTSWTVTWVLEPPAAPDVDSRRPEWDAVVFATRTGAEWSADELDGYLVELRAIERRARLAGAEDWGWFSSRRRAYEVRSVVRASTADGARTAAEALAPSLPDGWRVESASVRPFPS